MPRAVLVVAFFRGTSRTVVCVGPLAFKFARSNLGARCNRFEADLYRRSNQGFCQTLLCPPLYCFPRGVFLIMRRASPMTEAECREHVGTLA